jgi:hypothetical protein
MGRRTYGDGKGFRSVEYSLLPVSVLYRQPLFSLEQFKRSWTYLCVGTGREVDGFVTT